MGGVLYTLSRLILEDDTNEGVDGVHSAFAFVLRAILAERAIPVTEEDLVAVGGTKQRLEALLDGRIDGTTLHAPFDVMAQAAGCIRLASHPDAVPDLATAVLVAAREDFGSVRLSGYLRALDKARAELEMGGPALVTEVLGKHGWSKENSEAVAGEVIGRQGLMADQSRRQRGLEEAASLRARFTTGWTPPQDVGRLMAADAH